jgi:hypothetical protein
VTKKKLSEIVAILERPTPPTEVSWLPRGVKAKGNSTSEGVATAIPYISSAYVENTLDEAAGKFGWQTDLKQVSGVMCMGIGIFDPDKNEWAWRWDVGLEKSQDEHGSKSEVTGALKRAARQWGIGRDLKDYPKPRAACKVYKGGDGKIRFSGWTTDPGQAIMNRGKKTETEQPKAETEQSEKLPPEQQGGQVAGTVTTPPPTEEAQEEMTPIEARTMVFSYAVKEVEYSESGASKWIGDQEKEHGKTVEAYRLMYGLLVDTKKQNAPPEDWQPGQEEQEEAHA